MQSTSSVSPEPAPSDSSIIRAGSDGRLRFTPAQRLGLLDAFNRSGLSDIRKSFDGLQAEKAPSATATTRKPTSPTCSNGSRQ